MFFATHITGPFVIFGKDPAKNSYGLVSRLTTINGAMQPETNKHPIPFDVAREKALLALNGWRRAMPDWDFKFVDNWNTLSDAQRRACYG